jgi:DNA mismatch endonuclease (patch repair protein)
MMSGIRAVDTRPELMVRSGLHRRGFRFRLHDRTLPGKPDIVLPRYKAVVFIHGCFWHGHDCSLFKWPATRTDFWERKIHRNQHVDERAAADLLQAGWRVGVVWECATKGKSRVPVEEISSTLDRWLKSSRKRLEIRGV